MLREDAKSLFIKRKDPTKDLRELMLYAAFLVLVVYVSFILNSVIFSSVYVDGASMEPTLHTGDILYINKYKKPERGDIVVINVRKNSKPYIKRVIGLEGDVIELRDDGKIYIKYSKETDFKIINEHGKNYFSSFDNWIIPKTVTVGSGEVFFMGDNRTNSDDSTENGCRKLSDIVGVVTKWSLTNKEFLKKIYNIFSF